MCPTRENEIYGRKGRGNTLRQTYAAMVTIMDHSIGKIIAELKRKGLYENTIIWFMSDNGGSYAYGGNNKPLRGQKNQLWEGGVRAVSIMKNTGSVFNKKRVDDVIAYIDVLPTLVDLANGKVEHLIDGKSVVPVLKGRTEGDRQIFLGKGGLVTKRWKLVKNELFHLASDPNEENDVSKKFPDIFQNLKKTVDSFLVIENGNYQYHSDDWQPPKNWKMTGVEDN